MAISKKKAQKCITHHSCDCIEYKMQQMEQALRVIRTWGAFDQKGEWPDDPVLKPAHVIDLCDKALNCI
jgi:hypothetical protein